MKKAVIVRGIHKDKEPLWIHMLCWLRIEILESGDVSLYPLLLLDDLWKTNLTDLAFGSFILT